jgi:hypothetical protein
MTIAISHPWALTGTVLVDSVKEPRVAGFMTLANTGGPADRLVAATSPMAETIEIHGIKVVGPSITMRLLEKGVGLPPGDHHARPRGYHLMWGRRGRWQDAYAHVSPSKAGTARMNSSSKAKAPSATSDARDERRRGLTDGLATGIGCRRRTRPRRQRLRSSPR